MSAYEAEQEMWGAIANQDRAPAPASSTRPNRYAGTCIRCHSHVRRGAGVIVRQGGRWEVLCDVDCAGGRGLGAIVTSSGAVILPRNGGRDGGRCEDAPCCGCCD